jgi:DtxR family Mn-dependent transcriptional regulator
MDEILGFPNEDPHGSPIPDKDGKIVKPNYLNLTSLKEGESAKLCGLTNSSKELLIFLNKKNIKLGTILKVQEIEQFDKSLKIRLSNNKIILLTFDVCKCLLVELI